MDLWILSQKKDQLVKTNVVRYSYFKDRTTNDELHIITNNEYDFGIYETRERALEVLGEIQKAIIKANRLLIQTRHEYISTQEIANWKEDVIYEMPQE